MVMRSDEETPLESTADALEAVQGGRFERIDSEASAPDEPHVDFAADGLKISPAGGVLVFGWVDDARRPMESIVVTAPRWRVTLDAPGLIRRQRPDVERAIRRGKGRPHGFVGFVHGDHSPSVPPAPCELRINFQDGGFVCAKTAAEAVEDLGFRDSLLFHLPEAPPPNGFSPAGLARLNRGLGQRIADFSRTVSAQLAKDPYVERFGNAPRKPAASIVVRLEDQAETLALQAALQSGVRGLEAYELIYVLSDPSKAALVLDDAQRAFRTYGLDQAVVILDGPAGFSAAANAGAAIAQSERLVFLAANVFPRDKEWANRHKELVEAGDRAGTAVFGAALIGDDGALASAGLGFDFEVKLGHGMDQGQRGRLARVVAQGQGAPPDTPALVRPRPVPATSAEFLSIRRQWFEALGAFSADYVLDGPADADLCLRSLRSGTAPWIQDLSFWRVGRRVPEADEIGLGAMLLNRWLFTSRWEGLLDAGLLGPEPVHPLLQGPA